MIYEQLYDLERTGIDIKYLTIHGKYTPPHWHAAIELVYILNGSGSVIFGGKEYLTAAGEFVVIDSNQIHEMKCAGASMMLIIQFSRQRMKNYVRNIDDFRLDCSQVQLERDKAGEYRRICRLLKQLPPLYVKQPTAYQLASEAIAMEILFELLNHFAEIGPPEGAAERGADLERLGAITDYIESHYREPLSLEQIASHFYLSREYFSRYFKKNMGVSFLRYLNQIRLMHIYYDIRNTSTGVMELIEKHGFTNYKLFNKMFHEIYGCTPRQVREKRKAD